MKKLQTLILFLLIVNLGFSQSKQVLYNFAELPQTLLLNPASETNYKFHVGVPLLSNFSSQIGSSGFALSDLFAVDGKNINDKVSAFLNGLTTKDFLAFNTQIEIINAGLRLNDKHYINFGFYQEIDAFSILPKDLILLFAEGNRVNRIYNISQVNYKVDYIGVLHAGISKKVNEKLIIGGRFKIYSSAINLESNYNTGTFTTVRGSNNIYSHYFNNVNFESRTSGIIVDDEYVEDASSFLKNTFFGSNLGLGIDIGITYHFNNQLEFSGSFIDFGFIKHKKNIKNSKVEGNHVFEGVEFLYDPNNQSNYWEQITDKFDENLPRTENYNSYTSSRPLKFNAALKYSFGQRRSKICYDNTYRDFYTDAIGVQLFRVFRPLASQFALTGFYEKVFSKKFHSKITYTVDNFSYANIGAGISAQIGKVNIYGMLDNLLELKDLSSSNSMSLQLGINVIFN